MRNRALFIVICIPLLLGGCAYSDLLRTGAKLAGVSNATVVRVQDYAVKFCSFLPQAKTIRDIFATGRYNSEFAVADDICNAVVLNPKAEGPGGRRAPRVAGVVIQGRFVRR